MGDKLRQILATPDLAISWFDEKTNLLHTMYSYEHGERMPMLVGQLRPEGPFAKMAKSRQPLIWHTAAEGDALSPVIEGTDASLSGVFIPIISSDRVLGSMALENFERENAIGESELRLLTTIAATLGAALENAHLFDETQRRARETAALAEVGRDISATLDLNTVMERIAAHAKDLLQGDSSAIYLPDAGGQTFRAIVALGDVAEEILQDSILVGEGIIGALAQTGQAEFVNDTNADPRTVTIPGTERNAEERLMIAPLLAGERVTGMMAVWRTGGSPFNQAELDFLVGLSRQAAVAIENARLFDEAQRLLQETEQRAAELAAINTVSAAMAAALDVATLIGLAGEQTRGIFNADIAYVALLDDAGSTITFPYTFGEELAPMPYGEGLTSKIIQTGRPLLINQGIDRQAADIGAVIVGKQSLSYLGVPDPGGGPGSGSAQRAEHHAGRHVRRG